MLANEIGILLSLHEPIDKHCWLARNELQVDWITFGNVL